MMDKKIRSAYAYRGWFLLLLLFMGLVRMEAQDAAPVRGVVVSSAGDPLSNVAVSVEGSVQMPVVTDSSGVFSLEALEGDEWLIVSPAGEYITKRIYLNNRTELKIFVSSEDLVSGDDPVRIAAQETARRNVIASYTETDLEDLHHHSALSVDEFLQGKVPGMFVTKMSGMPGSGAVTSMRGVNSIYASNQPLIVVDGVPLSSRNLFVSNLAGYEYNSMLEVNNHDISRMTVVQDPTISAIYGSKASNGLIFIETLDPSVTQTAIDVDFRFGFTPAVDKYIPQLSASEHRTLMSELLMSSDMLEEEIVEAYPNLFLEEEDDRFIDYQHNTNWQDYIFQDAIYTNFNIHVKGGDEIARYGLSFGYTDAEGVLKNTDYQGYNLRFVSLLNIFTWLKMDAGVSLNYNNSKLKEAGTVKQTSPLITSLAKSPLLNPFQYDLEGNELSSLSQVDELGVSNPLATVNNFEATNSNYNFVATLGLTGTINRDMFVKSNFSIGYNVLKEGIYMPNLGMELYYNDEALNVSKQTNNSLNNFYNNTYLSYSKNFGNKHLLVSHTGMHVQSNKFQLDWGLTKNAHENDEYRNMQDGQNNLREIGGANRDWNWMSFYEYLSYTYKDKYMVHGSISLDGSSRVGDSAVNTLSVANVPFGLFYSGGLAWRLSGESFLKNVSWLDDLKVRASAGVTGNDDIGETSATRYYESLKFRETVGLFPATVPNEKLSYETVTTLSAGMDLSLHGGRFVLNADYYVSTTKDMVIFSPIDAYLGYDLRIENGGTATNEGWNASLFYRVIDRANFKWDLSANASTFKNEVTAIKGDMLSYSIPGGEKVNMVGQAANSFYGYIYKGVFSSTEEARESGLVNDRGIPFKAGDAIYEDLSGPEGEPDQIIDTYDKTVIGTTLPEMFGGLSTRFSYRRFSLGMLVTAATGMDVFNYMRYQNEQMTNLDNQSVTVLNRWQYEGHETDIPRATWDDPVGNANFSTRWIEDGSYVRLKNITLSYEIPSKVLVFRRMEVYVSVNNLFTLTNYLGYDPEFAFSHSQIYQGVDYGQMPQSKQFLAGIKIGL